MDFYRKQKTSIYSEKRNDTYDINNFIAELPNNMQIVLSMVFFNAKYMRLKFLKNTSTAFIIWLILSLLGIF